MYINYIYVVDKCTIYTTICNDKALLELNVAMLCTADILLPGGPLKGALLLLCLCFDHSTPILQQSLCLKSFTAVIHLPLGLLAL